MDRNNKGVLASSIRFILEDRKVRLKENVNRKAEIQPSKHLRLDWNENKRILTAKTRRRNSNGSKIQHTRHITNRSLVWNLVEDDTKIASGYI